MTQPVATTWRSVLRDDVVQTKSGLFYIHDIDEAGQVMMQRSDGRGWDARVPVVTGRPDPNGPVVVVYRDQDPAHMSAAISLIGTILGGVVQK